MSNVRPHEIEALKAALPLMSAKDKDFAGNLIAFYTKKGYLSDKQAPWVAKLVEKAVTPPAPAKTVEVGSMAKVYELFELAGKTLKFPGIVLMAGERKIKLSRAGKAAKVPGSINVVDRGADLWFGRIHKDGTWEVSGKTDAAMETALAALLTAFCASPATVAAEYGKLTGECCFCAKALSDEKSTAVGYGPVCAKKWGLPHGH